MVALDKKDLHVHTPFCPHRHSDAPIEAYLAAAEENGIVEVAFEEHAPAPRVIPQDDPRPNMNEEETELYLQTMYALREKYTGSVKFTIGLETEYLENCEDELAAILERYGSRIENGLISAHNVLVDGEYINLDYRKNIIDAAESLGPRKLTEVYYQTMIKLVTADLGPYKPKRIGHPTLLAHCGKRFPQFNEQRGLMDEFVAAVQEYGYALEWNTAGLLHPDACEEIYGESLLPYIKKYKVPVSLGSDAHEPERIGGGFDLPAIQNNLKDLHPVWETKI